MKSFIVWLSIACSLITMNVNAEDTHYQISMQMYRVQTSPSTELEAILNKKTALTFSDEQHIILGLLDELTKQFEIQFVMSDALKIAIENPIQGLEFMNFKPKNGQFTFPEQSVQELLESILGSYEIGYQYRGDTVHLWKSIPMWKSNATPRDELLDTLRTPVNIIFEDIHIKDLLKVISDEYNVNIMVDDRFIAPPTKDSQNTSPTYGEYKKFVSDGMIIYVNLKNVTLEEALSVLLKPLNLAMSIQNSFLWVTTPEMIQLSSEKSTDAEIHIDKSFNFSSHKNPLTMKQLSWTNLDYNAEDKITILSAPRLQLNSGQEVSIAVQKEIPIKHMNKLPASSKYNDEYEEVINHYAAGTETTLSITDLAEKDLVQLNTKLEITLPTGALTALEGTNLLVGPPEINKTIQHCFFTLPIGACAAINGPIDEKDSILTLIQVHLAPESTP